VPPNFFSRLNHTEESKLLLSRNQGRAGCFTSGAIQLLLQLTKGKLLGEGKGRQMHGNRGEGGFMAEFNRNPRKFQKFYLSSSTWRHFFSIVSQG